MAWLYFNDAFELPIYSVVHGIIDCSNHRGIGLAWVQISSTRTGTSLIYTYVYIRTCVCVREHYIEIKNYPVLYTITE